MDNLGSLLFGWSTRGEWNPLARNPSKIGFAFGQKGQGAEFLIRSMVTYGPGFNECMAKTAWEDFTRTEFAGLGEDLKVDLIRLAAIGPKRLFRAIFTSSEMQSLRQDESLNTPEPALDEVKTHKSIPEEEWLPIMQITSESCSGATCHAQDAFNKTYVDERENFFADLLLIETRLLAVDRSKMPPDGSSKTISEENKNTLLQFIERHKPKEKEQ